MTYQIQPIIKTETFTSTIDYINVSVKEVTLNKAATIFTEFYKSNGVCIEIKTDYLLGDDYLAWGNDDNYVINWVCKRYNLTLIENQTNI